jgi:ABC-2 type transport system permease protein
MNIWSIAKKDLLLLARDRRAVSVLIALPLVFIAIVGMSTGQMLGWRNTNEELRLAVVNKDRKGHEAAANAEPVQGSESAAESASNTDETPDNDARLAGLSGVIVERLNARQGLAVETLSSQQEARQLVADGQCTAAVIIGPEFWARVDEMRPGDVLDTEGAGLATNLESVDIEIVTGDPPTNASALARLIVHGEVMRVVVPFVLQKNPTLRHAMRVRAHAEDLAQEDENGEETAAAQEEWSSGYGSVVYQKIVPAYTVMFAFFLVTIMSRSFLTEREMGTLRRLKTTPVTASALMLGKTVPFYLISLLQSALLFGFGKLLFGMSWGPVPWLLIPMVCATSVAATGLGLLISTIVKSDAQVTSVATLVILAMAGISGCFMPRDWLPEAMRQISLATPHAWALIAYDQVLNRSAPDVGEVWKDCAILLAFGAGYFGLGWVRFRELDA